MTVETPRSPAAQWLGHEDPNPAAVDANRLVATIGAVAIAYLLTRARVEKARAKAAVHPPGRP